MDLHLFFKREGAASGLLASMLHQYPSFLDDFFDSLQIEETQIKRLKAKTWNVEVEAHGLDVLLTARDESEVIIIENKIRAGALQRDQLVRYYLQTIERTTKQRVGVLLVAPGPSLGETELQKVRDEIVKKGREQRDWVSRVSWTDLDEMLQKQVKALRGNWSEHFIRNAAEQIQAAIKSSIIKWPAPEGSERRIVCEMAEKVRRVLSGESSDIQLGSLWPSKEGYLIGTARTNLTMWLILQFKPEEKEPYNPRDWRVNGCFRLTIKAMVKLAGKARRNKELREKWEILRHEGLVLPHLGKLVLSDSEGDWLTGEKEFVEPQEKLVETGTCIGRSILEKVREFCLAEDNGQQ